MSEKFLFHMFYYNCPQMVHDDGSVSFSVEMFDFEYLVRVRTIPGETPASPTFEIISWELI